MNLLLSLKISRKKHSQNCLLSLQNLLTGRKQASSQLLSSWYCSLFVRVSIYRVNRRPSLNFKHHGPFNRLRVRFLSCFKKAWKSNFRKVSEDGSFSREAQELDEIFSLFTYEISFVIHIIAFGGHRLFNAG